MIGIKKSFQRPLSLLRTQAGKVCLGLLLVLGFSACKLYMAHLIGSTIDGFGQAEGSEARRLLLQSLSVLGLVIVIEAGCRFWARRLIIEASRHAELELKRQLMAQLGRLPLTFYDRAQTGDLISRLTQDVELLRFLVGPTVLYGSQALVMVPAGIFLMVQLSPTVSLGIAGAFAVLLLAMLLLTPRLQHHSRKVQEDIAEISQHAQESFSGIGVLQDFARTGVFSRILGRLNQNYLRDNLAMTRFRASINLLIHLCTDLVVLAVLVLGAFEVASGEMSKGDLLQFLIIMGFLIWPLIAAGWILGVIHRAKAAADRIEEIMQTPPEAEGGLRVELEGRLEVRNLSFGFPGKSEPTLKNISFSLVPGQKLGLVGPLGSGKSTLLALIMRLYDPPKGSIFVDGHDILGLDLRHLRQTFALAPQQPFLFSDTIADNVKFGVGRNDTEAADELLGMAVQASALEQDLESFAEGLDTIVGERGVTLSGGQKQRVSLARALAADRGTLVLDDTFSAVDHETETRILERLKQRTKGHTLLLATHRLSAVRDADLILVLREGRVEEKGRHEELLRSGGSYARAYRLQQEERALGGET